MHHDGWIQDHGYIFHISGPATPRLMNCQGPGRMSQICQWGKGHELAEVLVLMRFMTRKWAEEGHHHQFLVRGIQLDSQISPNKGTQ